MSGTRLMERRWFKIGPRPWKCLFVVAYGTADITRLCSGGAFQKSQAPKGLAIACPLPYHRRRTGGRVVEGTALEMRRTCKRTVGSNPTLSAIPSREKQGSVAFLDGP